MGDNFIETIATLVIVLAWALRAIVGPFLRRQGQPKQPVPPGTRTAEQRGEDRGDGGPGRRSAAPEVRQAPGASPAARPEPAAASGSAPTPAAGPGRNRTAELLRELGLDLDEMTASAPPVAANRSPVPPPPAPSAPPAPAPVSRWAARPSPMMAAPPPLIAPDESHSLLEPMTPLGDEGPTLRRPQHAGGLAVEVLDDLRGGAPSLARGILLAEVLGPPLALRPPSDPFD